MLWSHHAIAPERKVIDNQPRLLRKTDSGLSLQQSQVACQRLEHQVDGDGPNGGEGDNGAHDEADIARALDVGPRFWLVVRQVQERSCVQAERRVQVMDSKDHGQNGERDALVS